MARFLKLIILSVLGLAAAMPSGKHQPGLTDIGSFGGKSFYVGHTEVTLANVNLQF
jgi:hypothetical protein